MASDIYICPAKASTAKSLNFVPCLATDIELPEHYLMAVYQGRFLEMLMMHFESQIVCITVNSHKGEPVTVNRFIPRNKEKPKTSRRTKK